MNFWSQNKTSLIANLIYDKLDNSYYDEVEYIPFYRDKELTQLYFGDTFVMGNEVGGFMQKNETDFI